MFRIAIFVLFFLCGWLRNGLSHPVVHQLDVTGGLPSNRIYAILVDRHGYLWIATPEGVARYNGYEVTVFDISDGLPLNDVWELFEDNKGRIWLLSFAQSLGYIYNGQYHEAYVADSFIKVLPVPHSIGEYHAGVFLYSTNTDSAQHGVVLVEYKDTLYPHYYPLNSFRKTQRAYVEPIREEGGTFRQPPWIYTFQQWKRAGLARPVLNKFKQAGYRWMFMFNDYFLAYQPDGAWLRVYDQATGTNRKLTFDTPVQHVKVIPGTGNYLHLLADSILYQFNSSLDSVLKVQPLSSFGDISFEMISSIAEDTIWGQCLGATGEGVVILRDRPAHFRMVSERLSEYRAVGRDTYGDGYWWNDWSRTLVRISRKSDNIQIVKQGPNLHMKGVVPWDAHRSLMMISMQPPVLVDHSRQDDRQSLSRSKLRWLSSEGNNFSSHLWRVDDFLLYDTTELYLLSRRYGFVKLDMDAQTHRILAHPTGSTAYGVAYKGVGYDPLSASVWAYGNTEVVIYRRESVTPEDQITILNSQLLNGMEQILIDQKYGNIFLKKGEALYLLNRHTGVITSIEGRINVHKSLVTLHEDKLIVAGRFGVAIYKIYGAGRISPPVIYEQIRNEYYSNVTSVLGAGEMTYINTNTGLFKSPIPSDVVLMNPDRRGGDMVADMKLLMYTESGVRAVASGDTITLKPGSHSLQFDLINPLGNGTPRYTYHLPETDKRWQKAGKNDLVFPALKAGCYYTLQIQVSDDVQKKFVQLKVYVVPLWWQTVWMQRLLVAAGIVALLLLAWLTAWVTRRIMIRENSKKNMRMEIELKSIYAQINPHFINNTLNSILALIKSGNTSDAFYNVSRFSRLLRAYIKSSRNRYVSIGDEIENLQNYIELQQVRFQGKFDYRIRLEDPEGVLKSTMIPSLLLQPLVENAINHGLFHKPGTSGMLEISFHQGASDREIICIIEDNGVGRKASDRIKRRNIVRLEESYGSVLVQDLIAILNRYEQINIQIEYEDKQLPASGTIVRLIIRLPWKRS